MRVILSLIFVLALFGQSFGEKKKQRTNVQKKSSKMAIKLQKKEHKTTLAKDINVSGWEKYDRREVNILNHAQNRSFRFEFDELC
ncbi:MAG: hypothetical protein JXQ90_20495 [Cyclobacteriaceae bacterium]